MRERILEKMQNKIVMQGLTFDDVLLIPAYSEVTPAEVNIGTQLTRTSI